MKVFALLALLVFSFSTFAEDACKSDASIDEASATMSIALTTNPQNDVIEGITFPNCKDGFIKSIESGVFTAFANGEEYQVIYKIDLPSQDSEAFVQEIKEKTAKRGVVLDVVNNILQAVATDHSIANSNK